MGDIQIEVTTGAIYVCITLKLWSVGDAYLRIQNLVSLIIAAFLRYDEFSENVYLTFRNNRFN